MKNKSTVKALFIIMIPVLLLSCSAGSDIEPQEENLVKTQLLKKQILGKWAFTAKNQRTTGNNSFIEFLNDSSFVLSLGTEKFISNKYAVTDLSDISLENFGEMKNISIEGDHLRFDLTYGQHSMKVDASKNVVVSDEDKTQLLSRKWAMISEEDGKDTLAMVDSSFITFSGSGHYLIEAYTNGYQVPASKTLYWKWHPTISNRIVYWQEGAEADAENRYMIIRDLSNKSLKFTESNFWGLKNYVFIPAN